MIKAFGPRVVLVAGVVLAAVPFWPDSLLAQSRIFTSGVELVPLRVTVTDRAGRYMPDLTAADFAIFEEGRESRAPVPATTRIAAAPARARHPTVARTVVDEGSTFPGWYDTPLECDHCWPADRRRVAFIREIEE
jgi:hypothetical protein